MKRGLIPLTCLLLSGSVRSESPESHLEFVAIPAGEYLRGFDGNDGRENQFHLGHPYSNRQNFNLERPAHRVAITEAFEILKTEVTVGRFEAFVNATGYQTDAERASGAYGLFPEEEDYVDRFHVHPTFTWRTPGFEQTEDSPVVCVSWRDALAYCQWLTETRDGRYRLPTEAEWEYACRAGSSTWYSWGEDPDDAFDHANVADGALEAAHPNMTRFQRAVGLEANAGDGFVYTAPVASFEPNDWGVHDMHGNVWEWVQDRWSESVYEALLEGTPRPDWRKKVFADPVFLEETDQHEYGDWRVLRGGAWTCAPASVRTTIRTFAEASDATVYTGFRVVRIGE